MLKVATTRQASRLLFGTDATTIRIGLLATGVAALAIGIGLGLGPHLIATQPTPNPTASAPEATPEPNAVVEHDFAEAGFSFSYSNRWTTVIDRPDWVELASVFGSIYIHAGTPDGGILTCANQATSWIACQSLKVDNLDEFESAITASRIQGPHLESERVTIGGEEAVHLSHAGQGFPDPQYWLVMHGSRPYLIHFPAPQSYSSVTIQPILDSWRFLDAESPSTDPGELLREAGFSLDVPDGWVVLSPPGSSRLQIGGAEGSIVVRRSQGDQLESCGQACVRLPAATLEDVIAILVAEYRGRWVAVDSPEVETTPTNLDGVDATFVRVGPPDTFAGGNGPGAGSGTEFSAVVFRDGRAVVINWIPSATAVAGYFRDLLESFRFLETSGDQTSSTVGWSTYTAPDGFFAVDMPPDWHSYEFYGHGSVDLRGPIDPPGFLPSQMTIFLGDRDGSIRICQFGPCEVATVRSLTDLRDLLEVNDPAGTEPGSDIEIAGWDTHFAVKVQPNTLGGEPAERKAATHSPGWLLGPTMYDWTYAFHNGRPIVIRADHWHDALVWNVIDSLRFTDGE
jgi:hypothetical protein